MSDADRHESDPAPPPAVSSRNHIASLDELADRFAERLPMERLDLRDPATRERMRDWLRDVVYRTAFEMEWAYRRATDRALEQATTLMQDPAHYEKRKERRRRARAQAEEREREWAARRAELDQKRREAREEIRHAVEDGRVKPFRGLTFRFEDEAPTGDGPAAPEGS